MAWKSSVLVVANVTAASDEVLDALLQRAAAAPAQIRLVVPAADSSARARQAAEAVLESALARMRDAGLEAEGVVGDSDPIVAVGEEYDPHRFDEIVISTLPTGASKWLQIDLPHRIARLCDAPVTHIVSRPPVVLGSTPRPSVGAGRGVLAPLGVLSWGAGRHV